MCNHGTLTFEIGLGRCQIGLAAFDFGHARLKLGYCNSMGLARRLEFFVASVEDVRPSDELLVLFRELRFTPMKGRAVGL